MTCEETFIHQDSGVEVRACGFAKGGLALYDCQDLTVGRQTAIKYFFAAETARESTTLLPYGKQQIKEQTQLER